MNPIGGDVYRLTGLEDEKVHARQGDEDTRVMGTILILQSREEVVDVRAVNELGEGLPWGGAEGPDDGVDVGFWGFQKGANDLAEGVVCPGCGVVWYEGSEGGEVE